MAKVRQELITDHVYVFPHQIILQSECTSESGTFGALNFVSPNTLNTIHRKINISSKTRVMKFSSIKINSH